MKNAAKDFYTDDKCTNVFASMNYDCKKVSSNTNSTVNTSNDQLLIKTDDWTVNKALKKISSQKDQIPEDEVSNTNCPFNQ